jgi:protein SCO1
LLPATLSHDLGVLLARATLPCVRSRQLLALMTLAVGALAAVLVVAVASRHSAGARTEFAGSLLPPGVRAPAFSLRDQDGRPVSMAQYRGRPVIATFLYSHCKDTCPVEARLLSVAVRQLGRPAPVLAFSVDPAHDTGASVHAFMRKERLSAPIRWVLGAPARLRPIWKAYAITPQRADEEHMARIVLIDKRGFQRVGYPFDQTTPDRIAHDMRLLQRE